MIPQESMILRAFKTGFGDEGLQTGQDRGEQDDVIAKPESMAPQV